MLRWLLLGTVVALSGASVTPPKQEGSTILRGYLALSYSCSSADGSCDTNLSVNVPGNRSIKLELPPTLWASLGRVEEHVGRYVVLDGHYTSSAANLFHVDQWGDDPSRSIKKRATEVHTQTISKKYVTILAKFPDFAGTEPHTKSWYEGSFTTAAPRFGHFINEVTFGQWDLNGSIFVGWVTLPHNRDYYISGTGGGQTGDWPKLIADATAAVDAQVDFRNFDGINVFENVPTGDPGHGSGGRSTFTLDGTTRVWGFTIDNPPAQGENVLGICGHEMGHSFGLPHTSGPYGNAYDSRWDTMSTGSNGNNQDSTYGAPPVEYTAYDRDRLGVMPANRIYNAFPGTSRTIRLERLESPTASGYLMARVFKGSGANYYTVESRMNVGPYDNVGNFSMPGEAVLINDIDEFRIATNSTYGTTELRPSFVVDPDNDSDPNDFGANAPNDAQWKVGETYSDPTNGISIRVDAIGASYFTVTITVDSSTPWPNWVRNTKDAGPGSLRAAMFFKDHFGSLLAAPLTFRLPTSDPNYSGGVWKIKPETSIELTGTPIVVDATTQTAYGGNTNASGPEVEIDGSLIGSFGDGFRIESAGHTVKGFAVGNFQGPNIWLNGTGATGNRVSGCYVGINAQGTAARPSAQSGIAISDGASGNTIGGTAASDRNVVSGNSNGGIQIYRSSNLPPTTPISRNNVIAGNYVGTNPAGTASMANAGNGIAMWAGSGSNQIGGTAAGARNLSSGNLYDGIVIAGDSTGNFVMGNYVGTTANGSAALQNQGNGVGIYGGAHHNVVGGAAVGAGNLISGNKYNGVSIAEVGTNSNTVQGNMVGLNAAGTAAIPNNSNGISCWDGASNNIIGGASPGARNIVSGNTYSGLTANGAGTANNTFSGNWVGINLTGTGKVANAGNGVYIGGGATNNKFGGPAPGQGNVLSGNTQDGVFIGDAGTDYNRIEGNWIGVLPDGTTMPNDNVGVYVLDGPQRTVVQGNTIAFGYEGVRVQAQTGKPFPLGTAIRTNNCFSHTGVGINLYNGDNITPNDPGDTDTGPNGLQNYPVLTSATYTTSGVRVIGTLSSRSNRAYSIDFFASDSLNASGYAEGQRYLGSVNVTTNGSGNAGFTATVPAKPGSLVTATATDQTTNDTSEFSLGVSLPNALADVVLNPNSIDGGYSGSGQVRMGSAVGTATVVNLASGSPSIVVLPLSVTVQSGQSTASFSVVTKGVGATVSVTVAASTNGITRTTTLEVKAVTALSSLMVNPTTVVGGTTSTGTITLTQPAPPGGISVLLSGCSNFASIPASALVTAGQATKNFTVNTTHPTTTVSATITARLGSVTKTATLTITP